MKKPDNPENLNRELLVKKAALKTNDQDAAISLNELAGVAGGQADYQYDGPGYYCGHCGVKARQFGIIRDPCWECPKCRQASNNPGNDGIFIYWNVAD